MCRAKSIDWTPLLTHKLVDEMASHVKLYRRAHQKAKDVQAESSTDKVEGTRDYDRLDKM